MGAVSDRWDENRDLVLTIGVLSLIFDSSTIELVDCHYYPSFIISIISIGLLARSGYELLMKRDVCQVIVNNTVIIKAGLNNDINVLSRPVSVVYTSSKCPRMENVSDLYLWHCRLSHINQNRIYKIRGEGLLEVSNFDSLPTCESCLVGKMTELPFIGKGERASELLSLIHTDVCRPITISARGRYRYFITFADDLSRYGYVFLMRHKSESFEMFKCYHNEMEKQTRKSIKVLWSDRGSECLFGEFMTYLEENVILSQWNPLGTPQLYGMSERRNQIMLDMVGSIVEFLQLCHRPFGDMHLSRPVTCSE